MLSVFHGLFEFLVPKGRTETHLQPGISLHHTLAARDIGQVRDVLATETRDPHPDNSLAAGPQRRTPSG